MRGGARNPGECERVPVSRARVPKMGGGRREGRAPRRESTHREDVRHGVAEKGRPRGLAHRLCRVHRARGATLPGWECAPRGRVTKRQTATRPTSARNGSTNGKIVIGPILAPTSSGGSEESPPSGETRATRARDTGPRAEGASPKRASAKLEGHHVGAPPAMASRGCRGRPQGGVVRGGARSIPFPAPQA